MQPTISAMASKNICTRCLRMAAVPAARPAARHAANRRTFASSAAVQSSKQRQIHNSARQSAAPGVDSLHQPANEAPPYSTPRGRTTDKQRDESKVMLQPNNLYHSFSNSPSPAIRQRAAVMKQNAYCPHPEHQATRTPTSPNDLESRKTGSLPPAHVRYECPDCGIPVSCSEEHFADDYEAHLEICDQLREINEDDHDLVSGRFFPEFEYPAATMDEAQVNLTNWDTLMYSREFNAVNDERAMRQVTRLLTYPITVGSVLHELSPYNISKSGRLTSEGLRSMSALRYTLHPPRSGADITVKGLRPNPPPVRIFILGARAESSLPREVWLQLSHLFPRISFHLIFIGPESMANRDHEFPLPERTPSNPFGAIVEDRLGGQMKISTYVDYFHTLHEAQHFGPFDPYFDAVVCFHPGLGHPASSHEWQQTLPKLLDMKVPVICTGYTDFDMKRDIDWVKTQAGGEMDLLLEPGENRFRSLRWDLNDLDPGDVSCGNFGVWAFRGKRYEADNYRAKGEE